MAPRNPLLGPKVVTKGHLVERDAKGRNPPFVPTDAQRKMVRAMAAYGTPTEQIRAVLDISHVTLKKYFQRELDTAAPEANAQVAQALFYEATKGRSVPAMQFWLKMRARDQWRESHTRIEHTGANGEPIKSVSLVTNDPVEAARVYQKLMNGDE